MDFQTDLIIALQAGRPVFTDPMALVSLLGVPEFYLVLIPLITWCYNRRLGVRILLLLSISTAINSLLKVLFHTPRPYWVSERVQALAHEPSFGMPSGHAQASVVFLGYLGAFFKRWYIWVIGITGILLVAVARMYLGVHFLTDILTGWLFGFILLVLVVAYEDSLTDWFMKKPLVFRVGSAFFTSLIIILASYLIQLNTGTWQIPPEWSALSFAKTHESINAFSFHDTVMTAGILCGTGLGAVLSAEFFPYSAGGSLPRKIIRYLLGILMLLAFWVVLSAGTKTPDMAGYLLSYIRAAVAGIWITVGAPLVFSRLGLMDPE